MTERERWTVYPLLFFSLAVSIKDKIAKPLEFDAPRVTCRELVVTDPSGQRPLVKLAGSGPQNGQLQVFGPRNTPIAVIENFRRAGRLRLLGQQNWPRVVLGSDHHGAGTAHFVGATGEVYAQVTPQGNEETVETEEERTAEPGNDEVAPRKSPADAANLPHDEAQEPH